MVNSRKYSIEDSPTQEDIAIAIIAHSGRCDCVIYGCDNSSRHGAICPLYRSNDDGRMKTCVAIYSTKPKVDLGSIDRNAVKLCRMFLMGNRTHDT